MYPVVLLSVISGCGGSGGGGAGQSADVGSVDSIDGGTYGGMDGGEVTQNELNDDRSTVIVLDDVTPDASGGYHTTQAWSVFDQRTGYYEFAAFTGFYTEQLRVFRQEPEECIVSEGVTVAYDSLLGQSSLTRVDSGDLVVSNDAGTFLTIAYDGRGYYHYDNNFMEANQKTSFSILQGWCRQPLRCRCLTSRCSN